MNKIRQYHGMRSILIQLVELFSARMNMDKWRSGDFSIQTWYIPLEAIASKNYFIFKWTVYFSYYFFLFYKKANLEACTLYLFVVIYWQQCISYNPVI